MGHRVLRNRPSDALQDLGNETNPFFALMLDKNGPMVKYETAPITQMKLTFETLPYHSQTQWQPQRRLGDIAEGGVGTCGGHRVPVNAVFSWPLRVRRLSLCMCGGVDRAGFGRKIANKISCSFLFFYICRMHGELSLQEPAGATSNQHSGP